MQIILCIFSNDICAGKYVGKGLEGYKGMDNLGYLWSGEGTRMGRMVKVGLSRISVFTNTSLCDVQKVHFKKKNSEWDKRKQQI